MIQFSYRCIPCTQMTPEEISIVAKLFSENYGTWSASAPRTGNIKMSATLIKKSIVDKPDRYIAMVFSDQDLVGYAFYLKRTTKGAKRVTWILQLVVKKDYRGQSIGTKLMHSIWGMSDSWAWGLYTANPLTIKALEDATMRKVTVHAIDAHISEIKEVAYDLFDSTTWIDDYSNGIVNTNFHIDHANATAKINQYYAGRKFPFSKVLPDGKEWLAFVFSDQKPKATPQQIEMLLNFSMDVLQSAYSGMHMEKHAWAANAQAEVDFILSKFGKISSILDIGCGHGRHSIELAKRRIKTTGIDMLRHDTIANQAELKKTGFLNFIQADARHFRLQHKSDAAICLYDVIGSFPQEEQNLLIL